MSNFTFISQRKNANRILGQKEENPLSTFFENQIGRLLTVSELATLLSCSEGTIRNWVWKRRIPVVRPSHGMVRFDVRDIWNWLSERKQFV